MKKRTFAVLLLVMMTALCSCKGNTSGESGATGNNGSSSDSVVVGITNDMDSLDPHKAVAAGTSEVLYNIFEGLVKADPNGNMQPALCTEYEISDDALTYTFTLRDGVKFHNGEEVKPGDVVYSLKRVAGMLGENDIKVISAFSVISDIQAVEDGEKNKVVVTLSEPNTELIYYFNAAVIPEDYKEQESAPVGTGPFKFVSFSPMESIVIEKNEDYYGTPAYLDEVTFRIYANVDDAFMELLAGNIDIFPYLSFDQSELLKDNYNIEVGMQSLAEALYLNNADPLLSNVKVRQAISYAVDFKEMDEIVSGGVSHVLKTGMFPTFKEYYNDETESYYPHDPEAAKKLLAEAGYPDGIDLTITVPNNYALHLTISEILVDQLAEAGIRATVKQVDWSTWLSDVYQGHEYQATVIALDATMAPGDVIDYFRTGHYSNFTNFNNEEYDNLYDAAVNAVDQNEKIDLYKQAQLVLTENAASAWLMCPSIMVAVNKDLEGYTFYPIYVQDMSKIKYKEN